MPFVEDYSNWKPLESVTDYELLRNYFYENPDIWQTRPEQGFFAKCGWYKFPYCCNVPWYRELNTPDIIGSKQATIYNLARPLFDHLNRQLGSDYLFWGAELNSVPPKEVVKPHADKHFYSDYATRTHVVLSTNPNTFFVFETRKHSFKEGDAFIFNNKLRHSIENTGETERLHLVVDFVPKQIFPYIERTIAPFGGHFGTKHILDKVLSKVVKENFISRTGSEIYPCLTRESIK
jgi:hypothetical protein